MDEAARRFDGLGTLMDLDFGGMLFDNVDEFSGRACAWPSTGVEASDKGSRDVGASAA
jgi:hypothetical protein